jgi:hypothetical protein
MFDFTAKSRTLPNSWVLKVCEASDSHCNYKLEAKKRLHLLAVLPFQFLEQSRNIFSDALPVEGRFSFSST